MNIPAIAMAPPAAQRRDGWTAARRSVFLESLCERGDVRRACERANLSRQGAYKLRRRDPAFALAWNEALQRAHDAKVRRLLAALPEKLLRTPSTVSHVSTWRH